jgi:hypothetical protein
MASKTPRPRHRGEAARRAHVQTTITALDRAWIDRRMAARGTNEAEELRAALALARAIDEAQQQQTAEAS